MASTTSVAGNLLLGLKSLVLDDAKSVVAHQALSTTIKWKDAIIEASRVSSHVPQNYVLTKTLAFKPKSPSPKPIILLVALEDTQTPSSVVARKLDVKDVRMAKEDIVKEVLGVEAGNVNPLAIRAENKEQVTVALDSKLLSQGGSLAFHLSPTETFFLEPEQVQQHLLQTGVAVTEIDFAEMASAAAIHQPIVKPSNRPPVKNKEEAQIEGAALIGITVRKKIEFSAWYQQVLTKGDMLEYYDVSGCYIMKPLSYYVWECVQGWFDREIKKLGVENAYFPMFVSSKVLEREKDHIEGFAPEVAWVTRAGQSDLEEPIAIRPTSETVMYPYYAKWIRSHRDLPLKLNQWNSVVRWEFKHPQPFLRTREFLWQEGHTAHISESEAMKEVYEILNLYRRVYEDLLAVPVIMGTKSENEKFAGGLRTTTVEGFIPVTGRGVQAGTSHCLGQNFSKMFNIAVDNPTAPEEKLFVWQNSWGLSTRTIGVMVMTHGDDKGLVLPPRVAQTQIAVVPCGLTVSTTPEVRKGIEDGCARIGRTLQEANYRVRVDLRDGYTPGYKFNHWELRGVPLRLEFGPKDLKMDQTLSVRRDNGMKSPIKLSNLVQDVQTILDSIQGDMYTKAKREYDDHIKVITDWKEVVPALDSLNVILVPWCNMPACEDDIKNNSKSTQTEEDTPQDERAPSMGAKSLCIPLEQRELPQGTPCIRCGQAAMVWGMFGRSY